MAGLAALGCGGKSGPAGGGGGGGGGGDGGPTVSITPTLAYLAPSTSRTFAADVTGTSNTAVTWSITEGSAGGTIAPSGGTCSYTAPASLGTYHLVATSAADTSKFAVATVTVSTTTDLCAGLVTDKLDHPMTAVTKPAVGQSFVDPQFGTTIRRISDSASTSCNVAKPVYATIQAWNADESYLFLYHTDCTGANGGHWLYQGKAPYTRLKLLDIRPADLEQVYWDAVDPKILYYTDIVTHRLHRFNVDTDTHATSTVVRDFSLAPVNCATDITGGTDPMWTSWDGRYFGYTCGRGAGAKMFTYDKATDTVGTIFVGSSGGNAPQPAPSGSLFFLNMNDVSAQVRDANMVVQRTMSALPGEHATLGLQDGVDTFFSVQFDVAPYGNVVADRLTDGARRLIVGPDNGCGTEVHGGTHLSAIAYKNPGWMAVSIVNSNDGAHLLDNEVLLINANTGGSICRIAHHRSWAQGQVGPTPREGPQGYWAEPHVTISPSGTRVMFGSDWGGQNRVETYVVELPAYGG